MKLLRVRKHKMYVDKYIAELRWDIINVCLNNNGDINKRANKKITASTKLIKKYERRLRLLRY